MKYVPIILISWVLFSCAKPNESAKPGLAGLDLSIDTVFINPGVDFIHLRDNLWYSDISNDGRYLFNFNRNETVLEKIDLDNLRLDKRILFEKEGPNGIGTMLSNISVVTDEHILMWFYGLSSIFDQDGKLVRDLQFERIAEADVKLSEAYPIMLFEIDENLFFGFYLNWKDMSYFLMEVDADKKASRKIELPQLERLKDYSSKVMYGDIQMGSIGTAAFATCFDHRIIISNNAYNDISIYDTNTDSLYSMSLEGPLVGKSRSFVPPVQVEADSEQEKEVSKRIKEDISYGQILWDSQSQKFLRLSSKEKFGEEKDPNGAFKATGAEVFLSIFDGNFNLVSEVIVPELKMQPKKYFVKDGQIWIFENMGDELAFLRLSIK